MIEVNNDFKLKSKKVRQQDVKVTVGEERHKIKQLVYSFDGALFKTIMKQVEITGDTANQLKDKDINFKYGLYINNGFQYVDLGNFYIKDMEDDKKKEEMTVTGYDRMIRFMKIFKQSELQLAYPSTIITLVKRMCKICEVELYSTNFFNSDLVVNEDFFTTQELTYRDVLEKIAQVTLTTAFIKENKLYFCKPSNVVSQQLDKSYISNLVVKEKFGPLNALVLGRGSVEDNVESIDEESITQNGRCEIRFDENEFVQEQREIVIDNMFEQIKGLEYYSYEASDLGVMWLEPCDCIELGDRDGNLYKTYYLKANITLTTGISSDSEAEIPDEADTKYKVTSKAEKKTLKVERLAKKNEGLIQDLIQENTETTEKLTKHEQTLEGFTNTVSKIEKDVETVKSTANSSVKKVEVKYALSDSSTEVPSTGWNMTAPTWTEGKYMWQKTVTTFVDGTVSESNATCIQGAKGADGVDGKDGKDGVNGEKGTAGASAYVHVKYSDNGKRFTAPPNNLISTNANAWENGQYHISTGEKQDYNNRIRLKELLPITPGRYITDTRYDSLNGQNSNIHFVIRCYDKDKKFILSMGENRNGKSAYIRTDVAYLGITLGIFSGSDKISAEKYQDLVDNGLEPIICKESEYVFGEKAGPYIGILSSNNSVSSTTFDDYTWTKIKGETGQQGKTGTTGKGIKSVQDQYYLSTSNTTQTGGSWKNTQDEWEEGKYIWTRSFITWTDNTTSYTTPVLADGINKANQAANDTAKNLENNYSTTKEMTSAIEQSTNGIIQRVSKLENFVREKEQDNSLFLGNIAEGEGYILKLVIYGDNSNFDKKDITICASTKTRGAGELIYLTTETGENILTEDNQELIVGGTSYYIRSQKIHLNDILRKLVKGNNTAYDTLEILQNGTIQVIRRIGVDSSGNAYILKNEVIEKLNESIILPSLETGTYYFVEECSNLKYYAKYITKNDYSDSFLNKRELGTEIEQNAEHVRIAWNQISQFLQLEGIEGKATLSVYDKDKNLLMTLNDEGQHFYENDEIFGEMGVSIEKQSENVKNRYIAFSVDGEYDNTIENGMAWGVKTQSDGKFWPVLYIKDFAMPPKNSGGCTGKLVLAGCDLELDSEVAGICTNQVRMHGDALPGLFFDDEKVNKTLLSIIPAWGDNDATLQILDTIKFYANQAGSNTLKLGNNENYVILTDDGLISATGTCVMDGQLTVNELIVSTEASCSTLKVWQHIYCNNGVESFSTLEKKKNIRKYTKSAIKEIMNTDIYWFNYKDDDKTAKRRLGTVIGEGYNCSKDILSQTGESISDYSMISLAYKAIQEQQKEIEKLKNEKEEQDKVIKRLIERIEKMEGGK